MAGGGAIDPVTAQVRVQAAAANDTARRVSAPAPIVSGPAAPHHECLRSEKPTRKSMPQPSDNSSSTPRHAAATASPARVPGGSGGFVCYDSHLDLSTVAPLPFLQEGDDGMAPPSLRPSAAAAGLRSSCIPSPPQRPLPQPLPSQRYNSQPPTPPPQMPSSEAAGGHGDRDVAGRCDGGGGGGGGRLENAYALRFSLPARELADAYVAPRMSLPLPGDAPPSAGPRREGFAPRIHGLGATHLYRRPRRRKHTTMVTKAEFREIVASRSEGRHPDFVRSGSARGAGDPSPASHPMDPRSSPAAGASAVAFGTNVPQTSPRSGASAGPGSRTVGVRERDDNSRRLVSVLLDDDELAALTAGREAVGLAP